MSCKPRPKQDYDTFLRVLSESGIVRDAAKIAKIDRRQLYNRRASDPEFAKAWDEAVELGICELEDMARQRALEKSDLLVIFLLKAARPNVYKDRVQQEHTGKDGAELAELSDTDRANRIAAIFERVRARGVGPTAVEGSVGTATGPADPSVH